MTNRAKTIDALLRSGCVEHVGMSKKYRAFRYGLNRIYLVGRSGGLRCTRSTISESWSLTGGRVHRHLIAGGTLRNLPGPIREVVPCKH